jgi:toxin ParE1/3/4
VKPYRFLVEADTEFFEAIAYYDARSESKGDSFIDAVETAIRQVRTYPEIGPRITRSVRKRVITSFPYNLLYVNDPDEIVVIAVAPQRRRPGYWRRRLRSLRK